MSSEQQKLTTLECITINPIGETTFYSKLSRGTTESETNRFRIGIRGDIKKHFMNHRISHTSSMEYREEVTSSTGSMISIIVSQTHKRGESTSQTIRGSNVLLKWIWLLITSTQNHLSVLWSQEKSKGMIPTCW